MFKFLNSCFNKGHINFNNQIKIILSGTCALDNRLKSFEIEDREKWSFENFLNDQQSKIVGLGKVLGIGAEGVVIEKELEIKVMEGTESGDKKKAENIRLKNEEPKIVAMKFVKFKKDYEENFEGQGLIIEAQYITIMKYIIL